MIYLITWEDGRQAMVRASDEQNAGNQAREWREKYDPLFDRDVSTTPQHIEQIISRAPSGVLMAGWSPGVEFTTRNPT